MLLPKPLPEKLWTELLDAVSTLPQIETAYGVRHLMDKLPFLKSPVFLQAMRQLLQPFGAGKARPVRALLFAKRRHANWQVAWHQDTTIAVKERHDMPGYGPWTVKQGIPHVEPPVALLENLFTLRIHVDRADTDNGVLRVLPATHRQGRLKVVQIQALAQALPAVDCCAQAGDILLMRPLLIHSSRKSMEFAAPRRVIHIELSVADLPPPLSWAEMPGQ